MSYKNSQATMGIYQEHVEKLRERKPSLLSVSRFLATPASQHKPCHIVSINFFENEVKPVCTDLDFDGLYVALKEHDDPILGAKERNLEAGIDLATSSQHGALQGRILLIEDIDKRVMELLGSRLDIDPAFFAGYLRTSWSGIDPNVPEYYLLPSRSRMQQFTSIHHLRAVKLDKECSSGPFYRYTNSERTVIVSTTRTSSTELQYVGTLQHCTSILLTEKKDPWLAIILLDRHIDHAYTYNSQRLTIPATMYLGGYEDFLSSPNPPFPTRTSLQSDICTYWTRDTPPGFNRTHPSFLSIAYYPLRIIAAEWTIVHTLMHHIIRQQSVNPITLANVQATLEDPTADTLGLEMLQRAMWRSTSSAQKVGDVVAMLEEQEKQRAGTGILTTSISKSSSLTLIHDGTNQVSGARTIEDEERAAVVLLKKDFVYILQGIENHRVRLENVLPLLTSLVRIVDSRRSMRETANVGRLSILALIFVPLAYVASLFSMSERLGPGGDLFWVYFVVAVPVTAVVVLVARAGVREQVVRPWRSWKKEKTT